MQLLADKHVRLSQLRPLAPAVVRSLAAVWDVRMVYESNAIFTERDLLDLHGIVLTSVEDSFAGSYRTSAVRMAGASHVPPNPVKVPDLMERLFAGLPAIVDPVERAARLHHGIASIHPFADGNGRAARLDAEFDFWLRDARHKTPRRKTKPLNPHR